MTDAAPSFNNFFALQTWFSELPRIEALTSRHRTRSSLCLSFSDFLARFAGCKLRIDSSTSGDHLPEQEQGDVYTRIGNSTVNVLEDRIALERGASAVVTASGMSAIALAVTAVASAGDNIVTNTRLYGGTYNQFKVTFKKYGINVIFAPTLNPEDLENHINEKTKAVYVETIANSDTALADIRALADVAHRHGVPLIVDNTFGMGGYMVKPISLGADIVVHSISKWIGGHGTIIAGIIVDSGNFDWRKSDKFPSIIETSSAYGLSFADTFYPSGFSVYLRMELLRDFGPSLSPMSAFLAIQGIETLSLRAQRHCDNALAVAKYLETNAHFIDVTYLGLPSHPSHELALKTLRPNAFGGIITLRMEGGITNTVKFVESLRLVSHMANVGDAKTLVIIPARTIQGQLSEEEMESGGVMQGLIRASAFSSWLSIGIENVADIIADIAGALEIVYGTSPEKEAELVS
ncbi:Cys/Met metabolism PLP-dependent enzyme-domain-containing protein [Mycena rebaudengoi]|nr:Cys/Met metabolism PLP-dependent enzyme-domain-containing protein [Mycena rebaudengoi]